MTNGEHQDTPLDESQLRKGLGALAGDGIDIDLTQVTARAARRRRTTVVRGALAGVGVVAVAVLVPTSIVPLFTSGVSTSDSAAAPMGEDSAESEAAPMPVTAESNPLIDACTAVPLQYVEGLSTVQLSVTETGVAIMSPLATDVIVYGAGLAVAESGGVLAANAAPLDAAIVVAPGTTVSLEATGAVEGCDGTSTGTPNAVWAVLALTPESAPVAVFQTVP